MTAGIARQWLGCGRFLAVLFWAVSWAGWGQPASILDRSFVDFQESPEAVSAFRRLDPQEDLVVLDAALERIFGAERPPINEAAVLKVLSYVPQVTRLKANSGHLGSDCLSAGKGYCYGMGWAFVALCRRLGLPARLNGLHNIGLMQAHNTAEVHYESAWHWFDPTFGTFFYTRPAYDGQGKIPSLRELMAYPARRQFCFCTANEIFTGAYQASLPVRPCPEDYMRERYSYSLLQFYERVLGQAFPIIESKQRGSTFPIDIELGSEKEVWIGTIDGQVSDMFRERAGMEYPRFRGASKIGRCRLGMIYHLITLKTSASGLYRLTYHFCKTNWIVDLQIMELKGLVVGRTWQEKDSWTVEFSVQQTEAIFLVANPRTNAAVDAIHVVRVGETAEKVSAP